MLPTDQAKALADEEHPFCVAPSTKQKKSLKDMFPRVGTSPTKLAASSVNWEIKKACRWWTRRGL